MAGNFWQSSHYYEWILDKQVIIKERQIDLQEITEEEYNKVMIFYANLMQALGETLPVRQQVISTATVYFRRFYARNSLRHIDPLLLAPTCVFLASKVEECGAITNARLISSVNTVVKKFNFAFGRTDFPYRINHVLECEFFLLEMLDCSLIVFQPYRPLIEYCQDIGDPESRLLQLAWRIINDSLRTDAALLYPPYMISLAAIHMASVIIKKDQNAWFSDLSVDMDKITEITKIILSLYELWKDYDEKKEIQAILSKVPRPKTTPSRPGSQTSAFAPPFRVGSQNPVSESSR